MNCSYKTSKFLWKKGRASTKNELEIVLKKCDGKHAEVASVIVEDKYWPRPEPLNTIEFLKLASRKLKISSSDSMAIAESLYNKGLISYPWTETTVYHPTMFLKNFVKNLTGYPVLGKHAEKLMIEGNF